MRKVLLAAVTVLSVAACTPAQARHVVAELRAEASTFDESQVYGGCASGVIWAFGHRDAGGAFFDGARGTITVTVDGVVVRSYQPVVIADGTPIDDSTRADERTQAGQWVTNDDPHTWTVSVVDNGVETFAKSGSYACVPFTTTTTALEINHPADASTGAVGG